MLKTFVHGTRLRQWLNRPESPPAIQECKCLFDILWASNNDNTTQNEENSAVPLPSELAIAANAQKGQVHAWHRHGNVVYARSITHVGNVMFYTNGETTSPATPGVIRYIFSIDGTTKFAVC
jgi:hypothetical protein